MLSPGTILQGRYTIVRTLGQGGMGAVYLAGDRRLPGRRCAVKENWPDPKASPQALAQARQQFLTEASILAQLDHPNLPKVSDYFTEAGREYLVMDYVEGEDLESVLQRTGGSLPEKPVLLWAGQVLDAMEYLHDQRPRPIIHRDIKPANIRLTPQGKIKLVDFGLVKLLDPSDPRTKTMLQGMGTPEYTPLEQYASGPGHTDARSDIYSLGATLYHLLTDVAPPDVHSRMLKPGVLRPPRQRNPRLSENTERAVLRAIEIHPDQRYQSAREMKQGLLGKKPAGLPSPPQRGLAQRFMPFLLVAVLALLAGIVLRTVWRPKPSPTPTPTAATVVALVTNTATPAPATPTATTADMLTAIPTDTDTPAALATNTPAPTSTPAPTNAPTATVTPRPTRTNTTTPTRMPTPAPVTRTGAWLDTVVFVEEPSSDAAVTRLEVGDLDVYAYNISEPDIAQRIFDSAVLAYETAYGNYNDITFMPSSEKEFNDGRLNPFYSDKIREAMNWLIDRDYICQEITGGLAAPRFVAINKASKDAAVLADTMAAIAIKYAYNPDKAVEVITEEMEALGAEMVDGKWTYKGEPVVLIGLIRVEDERLAIGDYVANLLEDIGFTVERDYKTSAEASPCWLRGDPESGCMHYYTGGWVSTAISRDAAGNFSYFYTPDGLPFPPWQAYTPSDEFYEIATKLYNSEFATMEERAELMAQALELSLLDSQRIWLKDDIGVAPHAANVSLASDLSGSVYGSRLWAQTLRFDDQVGGSMTVAMPSMMTEPWNPIGGSNWVYDMMPIRGMQTAATVPDPFTGLALPMRLERAEVFVREGLPVEQNLDWATLEFVDEIVVPDDAWADWDAENQVFLTAAEAYTQIETVSSKVVMYYEEDFLDKMKWHDGSPVTLADMVMFMIMQFDFAKEASPIYDEAQVPGFQTFMDAFRGWRITSEDPIVIEYYTNAYQLDAENNVTNLRAANPSGYFNEVEASWHALAPGWRVEANGEAAFTADKADALEVEWMSYIAGPTLELLKAQLDAAQEEEFIPYEPTLGQYITAEEVEARYENLQEWYRRYGHFWVNTGPYYLQKVFPVEGTLILQYNPDYPDPATRWDRFAAAPIPEVMVDGPGNVTIGDEATYDIFVDFQGEPYAAADIMMVKYLVFDATGELAYSGDAKAVEDGLWQIVLSADATGALEAGSNQLAAIVVSKRVLLPVTETLQFVTQ